MVDMNLIENQNIYLVIIINVFLSANIYSNISQAIFVEILRDRPMNGPDPC